MTKLIIAVGGTGQKVAMAMANLVYLRAIPPEYNLQVIDGDDSNDGRTKALKTFHGYLNGQGPSSADAHPLRWDGRLMAPYSVKALNQADKKSFRALLQVGQQSPTLDRAVFDALFADAAANLDVTKGFFAKPAVGATAFAAQGSDTMEALEAAAQRAEALVLVGSLIGGTGAGVLPSIVEQLIDDKRLATSYGVFLLNWLTGEDGSGDHAVPTARMDSNFQHGSEYFYSRLKDRLKATALIGPPPSPTPLTRPSTYDQADASLFPWLAAAAVHMMTSDSTSPWKKSVLAWGQDGDGDLLDARLHEGVSLRRRIARADAVLGLLKELSGHRDRLKSEFGFFGFDMCIPHSLIVCRKLAAKGHVTVGTIVERVMQDLDNRRAALEEAVNSVRRVFPDAGKDEAERPRRGAILQRLRGVWRSPNGIGNDAASLDVEIGSLGSKLFDALMSEPHPERI